MPNNNKRKYLPLVITVLLFALVITFVAVAAGAAGQGAREENANALENSLRRAAVECYSIEGAYPSSWQYLSENYGVAVDTNKYLVHYGYFGQNIMPDITVIIK